MRILAPSAAGHAGDAGPSLYKTVNTAQNCCAERWAVVLSVLWLARVLRGPCFFLCSFSGLLARARTRDPSHKTLLFTVFCCICVSGLVCGLLFLGCFFWVLWRATPCQPSGLGPGWGPESRHPRHYLGLRWATCSHIIAHATFLMQKT